MFESANFHHFGRLVFCSCVGALREAHFRRPRTKEGKKLARGRKKRNAPRNEQPHLTEFLKRLAERRSLNMFFSASRGRY